jgi:hypothetical protein
MPVTVAVAVLVEWAATSTTIAVGVLQQLIAGRPGTKIDLECIRCRLLYVRKDCKKNAYIPERDYSPGSLAQRLQMPFFPPAGTAYPKLLTLAQEAKAAAAMSNPATAPSGKSFFS